MSELALREVLESGDSRFDEARQIIGYIVLLTALLAPIPSPGCGRSTSPSREDRDQTHGFEATREAAMEAFTRCWFRENKT